MNFGGFDITSIELIHYHLLSLGADNIEALRQLLPFRDRCFLNNILAIN